MVSSRIQSLAIIIVLLLITMGAVGCFGSDKQKKDDSRTGFDEESLSKTIPLGNSLGDNIIEPEPKVNKTISQKASNIIAIWYFEKNIVYKEYGGVLKFIIKNNSTNRIYIYKIGLKLEWYTPIIAAGDGVSTDVGKYVNPAEERSIGMLYFSGPRYTGSYHYNINFSLYLQNETGIWLDLGIQKGSTNSLNVTDLPSSSKYKQHYNVPQYYDKINTLVAPSDPEVVNLSRKLASNYSGAFNIYQVCALYDFVNSEVKYFSDPSSTENYWCTPVQTLIYGGDCEDHSILLASMIISLGGAVRMYMTDSHAFLGLYIGEGSDTQEIFTGIRNYYRTKLNLFCLEDDFGCWLIIDSIGSVYPGGLPLGAAPMKIDNDNSGSDKNPPWTWGFLETENLYIIDILPK